MNNELAKPLARYLPFKKVGDFIFLSGVIAVDVEAKKVIMGYEDLPKDVRSYLGETGEFSVDFKEGPVVAQSWYVLNQIQKTVESIGGQMSDVFKLVQYFKDLKDFPLYSRVRNRFFSDQPPVSTVVEVSGMLPNEDVLVEVEATVWLP